MKRMLICCIALLLAGASMFESADARDWYVSAATGKGKAGTIEKPAKDLGNIISLLADGDRIFIAEGTYPGRGENGHDGITVPVEIYGGWDANFKQRDPWGAHRTILSGSNKSANWDGGYRLSIDLSKWRKNAEHRIVVDGIIVDNGDRNRYATEAQNKIIRSANPKNGEMPTPESGGISVAPWKLGDAVIRNCIVMNTAPTDGAFSIWGHQSSEMVIENNLAINNTGNGFSLHTSWHPREGQDIPIFTFKNNTSLFNEKHDAMATYGGAALKLESDTQVTATDCVFAFNDYYGVDNAKRAQGVILSANAFAGNLRADYLEFDTKMNLDVLEDEAENLDEAEENVAAEFQIPIPADWTAKYAARVVIDRNAAEADVQAIGGWENSVRSILGLNLQGTDLKIDTDVWLPRLGLEDGIKAGSSKYATLYGCQNPGVSGPID
ncbi:MAG: right-handed parallel beta-helix repeat-containing protein [Candidatus Eisenbacteria bacterium]|uniref:Right-handed parallel beta-helix repeat-containing protein n=1 Tax=Eiseniibacteriota bacterium TaxID=2212470 RepID=A0A948RZ46_UNCEI|nr:right-handed parallel beta-helix repeat-containing protein [Candidatus Eisenbacteria bacterium]MBU1949730.1 right-handed parallel beta-helix repeat-containing protein [Candidatus Eisenbacteria bacterium]MBU2693066.1 right-handed parallel beta-helix repeat-containing protein [Candidatus Eisenbacteria bacterium]